MRIFFSGIGGVGIGPLAQIAIDAGYDVLGTDAQQSPQTKQLEKRYVPISYNQNGNFLQNKHATKPIDWYVYTSALPADHPELIAAKNLGITVAKRDELLAHIIAEKKLKLIAVAGTHGKTTTTGMVLWMFSQYGIPVSYSVGATLPWGPSGKYDPKSKYFIYECDEFDHNFLHFSPQIALITAVDYDHPDTYPTETEYKDAFKKFIEQSTHAIMWRSDADYINNSRDNDWILQDNEVATLNIPGEHNRRNGTLVIKALEKLNIGNPGDVTKKLALFPGTNRRFEKLAENLYSDYGHHPIEIAATLQMAHEINNNVVLIYQPHQNVRQHEIKNAYTNDVFVHCKEIYWLPTYLSRENAALRVLSPAQLAKNVTITPITYSELNDELWSHIQIERHKGRLVICMGAGSIDSWLREKLT